MYVSDHVRVTMPRASRNACSAAGKSPRAWATDPTFSRETAWSGVPGIRAARICTDRRNAWSAPSRSPRARRTWPTPFSPHPTNTLSGDSPSKLSTAARKRCSAVATSPRLKATAPRPMWIVPAPASRTPSLS